MSRCDINKCDSIDRFVRDMDELNSITDRGVIVCLCVCVCVFVSFIACAPVLSLFFIFVPMSVFIF